MQLFFCIENYYKLYRFLFYFTYFVVGYAQNGLQNGGTVLTPQFLAIGENTFIALQTLLPVGDDVDTDGNIQIQTLDAYGRVDKSYQWIDWGDPTGWCDEDWNLVEGVEFTPGQGLWVLGTSEGASIQVSGQVGINDLAVQLQNGGTVTGNPFPVSVNLQDILLSGDDVDTDGNIQIQTLDAYGRVDKSYQWIDWGDPTGWCDEDWNLVEGVEFTPGQGLWVLGTSEGANLTFPAPEL